MKERHVIALLGVGLGVGVFVSAIMTGCSWKLSATMGAIAWAIVAGMSVTRGE